MQKQIEELNRVAAQAQTNTDKVVEHLQIREAQERLATERKEALELDDGQVRVLEHFWDHQLQNLRSRLSIGGLLFLEQDRMHPGADEVVDRRTVRIVAELLARDLIARSGQLYFQLAPEGVKWLLHRHPSAIRWWQKLIERVPPAWQLATAVVSLPASVFGIIQFFNLFATTPPK